MQVILAVINSIYLISLFVTWKYYPAAPIFDLETDEIIGETHGLTWKHILMIVPFTMISSWAYNGINNMNALGVRPAR